MELTKKLLLGLLLVLAHGPQLAAKEKNKHKHKKIVNEDKEPWACLKNGHIVRVKGKSDRVKQDRCEAQFGIWQKKRHALEQVKAKSGKK